MKRRRIVTATDFARNLSSLLSEVRYGEVTLEIHRGKERVAVVQPPTQVPAGFPIDRLNALFTALPRLDEDEARAFQHDLDSIDEIAGSVDDPWDS